MLNDLEEKLIVIDPKSTPSSTKPDNETKIETNSFEIGAEEYRQEKTNILKQQVREREIKNDILSDYRKALEVEAKSRRKWSRVIISFVFVYITAVIFILILNTRFGIADNVLMVLVGSTSINVIGLVTIVVRFIFTNHHHKILNNSNNLL